MKINVYKLFDSNEIALHETAIKEAIFSNNGGRLLDPSFFLSPTSGCIKYFDLRRVWQGKKKSNLPRSMEATAKVAQNFFRKVNDSIGRYRSQHKISLAALPNPFPINSLKHLSTYPMMNGEERFLDHWVSNWMLHLPAVKDTKKENVHHDDYHSAPVYGGTIEVRIGPGDQIIGLISAIRLWGSSFLVDAYHHLHDQNPSSERDEKGRLIPNIFFILDSPSVKQTFLAPFFRNVESPNHLHGSHPLGPTCIYSLNIDIGVKRKEGKDEVHIFALVMGEEGVMNPILDSKIWKVIWFYGRLDHLIQENLIQRNSEEIIIDQPGSYHVEVSVEHIPTGAFRSTYQQVIVGGKIEFDREHVA